MVDKKAIPSYIEELNTWWTFLPKVKIELVVDDKKYKEAIEVIIKQANTGKIGDGKIFVYEVTEAIRIRTGEKGKDAV